MGTKHYDITLAGVSLLVTGTYTKGCPGKMYMPNGDPGYPGEPEDFEAEKVEIDTTDMRGKVDITDLLELDLSDVEEKVLETHFSEGGPDEHDGE